MPMAAAAAAAAEEGSRRFQALLAEKCAELGGAFERELRFAALSAAEQAAAQADRTTRLSAEAEQTARLSAEAERNARLVLEVQLRQLELELDRLRAELNEHGKPAAALPEGAAPSPNRAPSESVGEASDVDPFGHILGDEDSAPPSERETRQPPEAQRSVAGTSPTTSPGATAWELLGAASLAQRERAEAVPVLAPGASLPPSRIPKPTRLPLKGTGDAAEEAEDQRMLKHNTAPNWRQQSGSPIPEKRDDRERESERERRAAPERPAAAERSTTPSGLKAKRKPQHDDDHLGSRALRKEGMQDKRTLRKIHKDTFRAAIQEWCESRQGASASRPRENQGCQVFVRLRPMFEKEWMQGEFESVTVFQEFGEIVVHSCLFQADLVRMFIQHSCFLFPQAFGAKVSNEEVYAECGSPLVAHALSGNMSTVFMFGQTGSGKTYTMHTIIGKAADDIFEHGIFKHDSLASEAGVEGSEPSVPSVMVRAFEIKGNKCLDLLSRSRTELKLMDSDNGRRTNIVGAEEVRVTCAEDLRQAAKGAFARRKTASHGRNEESSRSHCILLLELPNAGGSLVLVDCAGTERRQDTDQHSAERTKESAEINSSLHVLKECIRNRARERLASHTTRSGDEDRKQQVHVPYRGSCLTRVLFESFTRANSRMAAVGTISPAATDVEHSLSTLRTLQLLMNETGSSDAPNFEQRVDVDPKLAQLWSSRPKKGGGASREGGATAAPDGEARRGEASTPGSSHRRIRSDTAARGGDDDRF